MNMDDREMVELYFSATKLKNKDGLFGVSDPRVVLQWMRDKQRGRYMEVGRTETIKNDPNPFFKTAIDMPFIFEEHQHLRVIVEDEDGSVDDIIGIADFEMAHVISARERGLVLDIYDKGRKSGKVTIKFQKIGKESHEFFMHLR